MIRRLVSFVFAGILLASLSAAPLAWAQEIRRGDQDDDGEMRRPRPGGRHGRRWVPEFDATTAGAIAVIVAGGAVLVARRRKH